MRWVLAFHLIFVICWFSGLFYLPRLFVYHAQSTDVTSLNRFKLMESRLYWGIIMPSSILTTVSGCVLLVYYSGYQEAMWMLLKLFCVLILWIYQCYCGYLLTQFRQDSNMHTSLFYRWLNELPTVLLIAIVILAVVRPF